MLFLPKETAPAEISEFHWLRLSIANVQCLIRPAFDPTIATSAFEISNNFHTIEGKLRALDIMFLTRVVFAEASIGTRFEKQCVALAALNRYALNMEYNFKKERGRWAKRVWKTRNTYRYLWLTLALYAKKNAGDTCNGVTHFFSPMNMRKCIPGEKPKGTRMPCEDLGSLGYRLVPVFSFSPRFKRLKSKRPKVFTFYKDRYVTQPVFDKI